MSTRKNKGLGASWANKNVKRVEEAAGTRLSDIKEAQKELEAQRQAFEQQQQTTQNQHTLVMLSDILTHGDTQPRVQMDEETWQDYALRMIVKGDQVVDPEGQVWPALELIQDGDQLWLTDGFHRLHAAQHAGLTQFQAHIEPGTQRDAVEKSLGANARHGKRRTNADKRRAVERALLDTMWIQWTDARVARLCNVTSSLVGKVRQALELDGEIEFTPILHSEDGREFERQPPKRVSTTPTTAKPTKKTKKTSRSSDVGVSLVKQFGGLSRYKKQCHLLVAYPSGEKNWKTLLEHANRLVEDGGHLIVPVASGSDWLWRGPMMLDGLIGDGFMQPVLVWVEPFARHYLIWHRGERTLPDRLNTLSDLSSKEISSGLVVGLALDDWSAF